LLEKGNPYVLLQAAELLIVGRSVCGIVLIANPPAVDWQDRQERPQ
jgi:hypothetical protein